MNKIKMQFNDDEENELHINDEENELYEILNDEELIEFTSEIEKKLKEKTKVNDIFDNYYIKPFNYFYSLFNKIPNVYKFAISDEQKLMKYFEKKYKDDILKKYFIIRYEKKNEKYYEDIFFIMKNNDIIRIIDYFELYTISNNEEYFLKLKNDLSKFVFKIKREPKIWLLIPSQSGIKTLPFKLNKIQNNILSNYNDDFEKVNNQILKFINEKNKKGVYLFHGIPGSGKTSYIRYLASKTKRKVIFLSPQIAQQINQPEFTDFLFKNSGSILIIEDAELLIKSRDISNSPVSSILNITDGLLSDELNIQIICTFNTDKENIDKALLRKGRLLAIYDFKKLTIQKSNNLLEKLYPNKNYNTKADLTLAEIYNYESDNFSEEIKINKIGF